MSSIFQYLTPIFPKRENSNYNKIPIYTPKSFFAGKIIDCNQKWITWLSASDTFKVTPISSDPISTDKQSFGLTCAHEDVITNIQFSPFKDNILMTSSHDHYIKFWEIDDVHENVKRINLINIEGNILTSKFHPTVENLVSTINDNGDVFIVDTTKSLSNKIHLNMMNGNFSSMNWKIDGSLLSVLTTNGCFSIVDPRKKTVVDSQTFNLSNGNSMWIGNNDLIISFGKSNNNQIVELRDCRNMKNVVNSLMLGNFESPLIPLYDSDTGIIICTPKNESSCILAQLDKTDQLSLIREINLNEPTIDYAAMPKSSLNVTSAEVLKIIQLGFNSFSPYSFNIPLEYTSVSQEEFSLDTSTGEPALSLEEWRNGSNKMLKKISLYPISNTKHDNVANKSHVKDGSFGNSDQQQKIDNLDINDISKYDYKNKNTYQLDMEKYSKFRYIDSQPYPKSSSFTAYNQIFLTTSNESTGVACIKDTLVLPIRGSGGKLGVVKLSNPHRIPSTGPFNVENKGVVNDFALDPFDEQILIAVCENNAINVWKIPENGLTTNLTMPIKVLKGHHNRATLLKYHHMAKNIIASSDIGGMIMIWDIDQGNPAFTCNNSANSHITGMAWDPKGITLAATSIDKRFSIFDPRSGNAPINSAFCSESPVGSRPEWADDHLLLISALKSDGRQTLKKIDIRKPNECLAELLGYESPSPYILYYDHDINVVFGFNKGGNTIQPIELRNDGTGFFLCDPYKAFESHQTVAFLRKDTLNVGDIEIAKSIRILDNTTELVKHKLIRSNEEYFQDDVFPPTCETWKPSMSSKEWSTGKNTPLRKISLAPKNMIPLSQAKNLLALKSIKYDSRLELEKAAQQADEEFNIVSQFIDKVAEHESEILPQDAMEGLSDSEWND